MKQVNQLLFLPMASVFIISVYQEAADDKKQSKRSIYVDIHHGHSSGALNADTSKHLQKGRKRYMNYETQIDTIQEH